MRTDTNSWLLKAAVLSASTIVYFGALAIPALGEIALAFPEVSKNTIRSIATLPAVMMLIFPLISEWLTRSTGKRNLLCAASALVGVFGILPAFYGGIEFLMVTRLLFGVGLALAFPLAAATILEFFQGAERERMLGYSVTVGAFSGIVFQFLGGFLASIYWRYAFWGCALIIPVILLIYWGVPNQKPEVKPVENPSQIRLKKLNYFTLLLMGICILGSSMLFTFITNAAMVIQDEGLGNARNAGLILACYSGAMATGGFFFARIYNSLNKYAGALGIAVSGIAFQVLLTTHNVYLFALAASLLGFGYGIYYPVTQIYLVNSLRDTKSTTLAVSVHACCIGTGQFINPYLMKLLTWIVGLPGGKGEWRIASAVFIGGSVLAFGLMKINNMCRQSGGDGQAGRFK